MILRNLSVLTVALSLGGSANASTISSGFYVGMGAGMERMNGQRSERMDSADSSIYSSQTFTQNKDMKKHGPLVNVFGGGLYRCNNFAVAGEAFFEMGKTEDKIIRDWFETISVTNTKGYYSAVLEKRSCFGFRVNVGGIVKDRFFVYGLLGLSATQLRYSTVASMIEQSSIGSGRFVTETKRKLAYGFDYGVGVQYQINQWRIGIEGYIRKIKSQQFYFQLNDPNFAPEPTYNATVKPFITGVNIKFSLTF
ncbi:outer membrane protein [Candidatus Finniella inopinata]|nr:outer membrane beta-barrel protein [Candidatus Finniella inopinata]